jgi:hypothetical protein
VLVEVRCGNDTVLRSGFMDLFREAEQRTHAGATPASTPRPSSRYCSGSSRTGWR